MVLSKRKGERLYIIRKCSHDSVSSYSYKTPIVTITCIAEKHDQFLENSLPWKIMILSTRNAADILTENKSIRECLCKF